jgi:hypothetical protein
MQLMTILKKTPPRHVPDIDRVLDNATRLKRGLVWCKREGLAVLSAEATGARPEILVESCRRCAGLVREGLAAEIGSQVVDGLRSRVMCAVVEGCNIKWIDRR